MFHLERYHGEEHLNILKKKAAPAGVATVSAKAQSFRLVTSP
jgi:hypothetical protein